MFPRKRVIIGGLVTLGLLTAGTAHWLGEFRDEPRVSSGQGEMREFSVEAVKSSLESATRVSFRTTGQWPSGVAGAVPATTIQPAKGDRVLFGQVTCTIM